MDEAKVRKLAEAGWTIGDIKGLLGLTDQDTEVIDLMLVVERKLWSALAKALGERDGARIGRDDAIKERDQALKQRDQVRRLYYEVKPR